MRWDTLEPLEGFGPCTVCGRDLGNPEGGDLHCPHIDSLTLEEYRWIEALWAVDPLSDFDVCQECVAGHHDPCDWTGDDLHGTTWLNDWIAEHDAGRPVTLDCDDPNYADEVERVHGKPAHAETLGKVLSRAWCDIHNRVSRTPQVYRDLESVALVKKAIRKLEKELGSAV